MAKARIRKKLSAEEAAKQRAEWNIPDWKDETAYDYVRHDHPVPLVNDQLRWEFLRRNENYRFLWNDIDVCRSCFGLIKPINPALRGDQLNGQTVLFIDSVMQGSPVSMAALHDSNENIYVKNFGEFLLGLEQDGFVILGFSPFNPIKPQIQRANKILEKQRQELKQTDNEIADRNCQIEHPGWLLRTIDAYYEGVPLRIIGETLFLLAGDDREIKNHARATAHQKLKAAQSYWQRVQPKKRNVLM